MSPLTLLRAKVLLNQGEMKLENGELYDAITDFEQAIALYIEVANPDYAYYLAKAYERKGAAKYLLGNLTAAILDCTEALNAKHDYALAYYTRALIKTEMSLFNEAIKDLNTFLAYKPNDEDGYFQRGYVKYCIGEHQGAEDDFMKANNLNPELENIYQAMLEKVNVRNNQERRLTDIFNIQINENPQNSEAYLNRGLIKYDLGNKEGALADYTEATNINPNNARAFFNKGKILHEFYSPELALNEFNTTINIDNNFAEAYYMRGTIHMHLKDYENAILDFNRALEIKPDNIDCIGQRGDAKYFLNNYIEAIADYTKVLSIEPENGFAFIRRADAFSKNEQFHDAINDFDSALRINPDNEDAYFGKALCREIIGDLEGAVEDYQRVLELNPNAGDAKNNLSIILNVDFLVKAALNKYNYNDIEGARWCIKQAVEIDASEVSYRYDVDSDNIDNEIALAELTKIIELFPEWPDAYYYWASNAYDLGSPMEEVMNHLIISLNRACDAAYPAYNNHMEIVDSIKDFLNFILIDILIHDLEDQHRTPDEVLNYLNQIVEIAEDWEKPFFHRGYIKLVYTEEYAEAINDFSRVIEIMPENANAYYNRGEARYKLNDFEGATADYNAAVAINPDDNFENYENL